MVASAEASARQVLANYWDRRLPVNLPRIADWMGARVVVRGGGLDAGFTCRGRVSWRGFRPVLEVNAHSDSSNRRIIVAHLLGHYALKHHNCAPESDASFAANPADEQDRQANAFAAELLMPLEAVRSLASGSSRFTVEELARAFDVPVSSMAARWESLSLRL